MTRTKEADYINCKFSLLGRQEKLNLLYDSNLNDYECNLLTNRFVLGKSLKECSDLLGLELNTVSKKQLKAIKKLYTYLIHKSCI